MVRRELRVIPDRSMAVAQVLKNCKRITNCGSPWKIK
jgi:hypothetical protein